MSGKQMTPQRMREIAAGMIKIADDKARHAKAAAEAAKVGKERGGLSVGAQFVTAEELERYAKITADEAAEWAPIKVWAHELQDHSFTMKV